MDVEVRPSGVAGEITPPPSKSETHRGLFATALAGGGTVVDPLDSGDTLATVKAIRALGGEVEWTDTVAEVLGFPEGIPQPPAEPIDCRNSGTTLRLAIGIAALASGSTTLTGDGSLRGRPNGPLLASLEDLGASTTSHLGGGTAPVTITGPITGGQTAIEGSVSSQFVSSLLLAGSRASEGVVVSLTSPLQSAPYLDLTIETLHGFGVTVDSDERTYRISAGQTLHPPGDGWNVGPDPTAASYPLTAGLIAGSPSLTVTDVGKRGKSPAPILDVLQSFQVSSDIEGRQVTIEPARPEPATIDLGSAPDLLPTAAVIAAHADGTSHLVNCEHARYKETDRIQATAEAMRALGVPVSDRQDGVTVRGRPDGLAAGEVDPRGDHRLAMAAAVAGLAADGPVLIRDADCVEVSYPNFFEDLAALGADIRYHK